MQKKIEIKQIYVQYTPIKQMHDQRQTKKDDNNISVNCVTPEIFKFKGAKGKMYL